VPRVVTLKYADSEDLCEQLNAILNEAGTVATIRRSQSGLSANSAEQQGTTQGASTSEEESPGTIKPWWTGQQQSKDKLPPSNLIGRVRFVPVHRSKAMLVLSPPEYMDDMITMIEELDRPGMQVMVKAVIMEVNLQDSTSLGVRLSSDPSAFGTIGVNAVNFLNELQNVERSSDAAEIGSSGDLRSGSKLTTGADINALVDLLVKKADGRILNQPTLWTKDNEEAKFVKGQKVAFIESDQTDRTNLSAVNRTFTYEDVGVTLRVRPNITPEKAVDMTINLNISQVETELINTQIARKNLDTTTHLIVNDGQTILMGGILFQNDEKLVQKIPLLGDIPILGALFRHTGTTLSNSELLVFVTPYVIDEHTLSGMPSVSEQQRREAVEGPRQRMEKALENLSGRINARWTDPNDMN